jgi:hypothetical protein
MFAAVAKALKAWRTLTYIKVAYCKSSGSFAIFAAIRRRLVPREQFRRRSPTRVILEIDIGEHLSVVVADDEARRV